jgi:predicted transcriptional regulator
LGRVIKIEGPGKDRQRLARAIVLALRELMQQSQPDDETRNLAAFIGLALQAVHETIDETVTPWEKRGYWLKADRFRLEWEWTGRMGKGMRDAVLAENWAEVAGLAAQVAQKLDEVNLPKRHRMGTPWEGAWEELQKNS